MTSVLRKFPNDPAPPYVARGDGAYIYDENDRRLLDFTAGWCAEVVLGYNHPEVLEAMRRQMDRFCHMDHNIWRDHNLEALADLIVSNAPPGLNKVYFAGNSGSEAIEAALKLSYQTHWDAGKRKKKWLISREQAFHGATLHAIAVSQKDILDFYDPLLPTARARISQHHPLYEMREGESLDEYAQRGADELEAKILEIGPENVASFIGETIMGGLVGDVPPAPNYWKYIEAVCHRYDVHLILDEIYCGLGRSGKIYCCAHDEVTPDFICVGKTLGAGYAPISAVVTSDRIEQIIASGQGRIQHGHTFQGYSLGAAVGLAVQKIVHRSETLKHVNAIADYIRAELLARLGGHPYYRDLRGRGLAFSLEYQCPEQHAFGQAFARTMANEFGILISAKWHRIAFTPPFIITLDEADQAIEATVAVFTQLAANWPVPAAG